MRLQHFCIGSITTQDLLISKTFLPAKSFSEGIVETDIQKIWAIFLDLFQSEHQWTPSKPDVTPTSSTSTPSRISVDNSGKESTRLRRPLYSRDCCFVYYTVNDIILVSVCPSPPTPSIASSAVTRIPLSLPGQTHTPKLASSSTASPAASGILPSIQSGLTTPIRSPSPALSSSTTQSHQQQQYSRPELAFSTSAGLHLSLHGLVEFLMQLVKALERYLLAKNRSGSSHTASGGYSGDGSRRVSQTSSAGTIFSSVTTSLPSSPLVLSADLIQLNTGIVYEILDECMELGYPVMPSLAQLDLLIFGTAKTS